MVCSRYQRKSAVDCLGQIIPKHEARITCGDDMDIKPVDQTVKTLLESFFYLVPRFQRPYSWDRENVADLWNDAITSEDEDYFIGSFVVYRASQSSDILLVVDGQQRITTITLLLAALRDALHGDGHEELAKGIQRLIERPDLNNEQRYVLRSESPYPYLQEYIQKYGAPELEPSAGSEEDALKNAYQYLKSQITTVLDAVNVDASIAADKKAAKRKAKLLSIRDRLMRLQLILIQLNSEDDAYLIFETLNTRGKDLTVADLVKNHLTRILKVKNKGVDAAREKWENIRAHFDESEEAIDINRFLHHSWLSRSPYLPEKKLFKEIKHTIGKTAAQKYLDQLQADSRLYRRILEPVSYKWKKEERQIFESLRALVLFRVVQPVPMLLSILRAYEGGRLSVKQTRDTLRSMENFHFQFSAIAAQRTGGGTGLMFALAARALEDASTKDKAGKEISRFLAKLRERLPSPAEFAAAFSELQHTEDNSKQRLIIRYLLARLDFHQRKHGAVDYDKMSIEHIAPQKSQPGESAAPANVGRVGNLLLVSETLNNEVLANKPFLKKKSLYQKGSLPLDPTLSSATTWTATEIDARTKAMATLVQEKVFRV
jgi:uncharacterized protein with ParB-like and HNH nuclease domain